LARIEAAKRNMSLSALVRRSLEAMVQGRAPVLEEKSAEDLDRSQRESLVRALQDSELKWGMAGRPWLALHAQSDDIVALPRTAPNNKR
jgi:hypothetical protein